MDDTLFSETPVAGKSTGGPLLVVGLPRSGSSFLSDIISQIEGWYVFDDLYLQRKATETGATGTLTPTQLDDLLYFLGWQIRARLRSGKYAVPKVAEAEVEAMNHALKATFAGAHVTWAQVQEEWMTRLAARSGCANWGYKMPQAFRNLDRLFGYYPNMKVIFLMRAPQDVLASYKYMRPDSQDGNPAQYHPVAHAIYWRQAARAYLDARMRFKNKAILVRFEDLVQNPGQTAGTIASFLKAPEPKTIRTPPLPNTSFRKDEKRRTLNGLELSLLNLIAGKQRHILGFETARHPVSVRDFASFIHTSLVFIGFRIRKLVVAVRRRLGGPV